jgi:hypothetical protein
MANHLVPTFVHTSLRLCRYARVHEVRINLLACMLPLALRGDFTHNEMGNVDWEEKGLQELGLGSSELACCECRHRLRL